MNKILIEPLIDGIAHGQPIQAKKFSLALRITNNGKLPSEKFTITNITLKSSEGQNIFDDFCKKQFFVDVINPDESRTLSIGNNGQFMYGIVNLTLKVQPQDSTKSITFLQKNPFTEECIEIDENGWIDFFYIKSANEFMQGRVSIQVRNLTYAAAVLAFVQAIPILKKIYEHLATLISQY